MPTDRLERLRLQVIALRYKVRKARDLERQKLLLLNLVDVVTAFERAQAAERPSNRQHHRNVAARHAEVERDFVAALARHLGSTPPTALVRSASASATTATV